MIHESQSVKTVADVVTSVFAYSEFVYLKFKNEQSYYMYCLFYDESCIFEYFFVGVGKSCSAQLERSKLTIKTK